LSSIAMVVIPLQSFWYYVDLVIQIAISQHKQPLRGRFVRSILLSRTALIVDSCPSLAETKPHLNQALREIPPREPTDIASRDDP
jgi:hypothetical protein